MPFDVRGRESTVALAGVNHELIRASKDGNCLFHAAGHALVTAGHAGPELANHALLRAHVVAYVALHAKDLNALGFKLRDGMGIALNAQGAVSVAQGQAIDRQVAYLRGLRNWGDEACITAIERLYGVEVLVFDDQGAAAALGVPYYAVSHAVGLKIRLCIRLLGDTPVHYDVYLPDYDALRDGAAVVLDAPRKGGEISQSAKAPWAYHLAPEGLNLFCPALDHRQMAFSRAVIEGLSRKKVVVKPVSVALGGQSNVILGPPAPVVAVRVRNRADKAALTSASFAAQAGAEVLGRVVEEPLILPLVRVEGVCINLLDFSSTDLVVDLERGKAPLPVRLYVRVYQRAFGHAGASVPHGGLLGETVIDLAKAKAKSDDIDEPALTRITLNPADALPDEVARLMTWQASPFQIVVSSDPDFEPGASAWTHAHVPSEFDILLAEYVAGVPVKMLGDSPMVLADLGIGATVAAVANPAIDAEAPKGRETFAMPADKEVALGQLLNATGLGTIDTNFNSYLIEVAPGEWYVATSWASMAALQRNPDDDCYYLRSLYWSGSMRGAFVATAADLAQPGARAAGEAVNRLNRVMALVTAARSALNTASNLTSAQYAVLFPLIRSKDFYSAMWSWNDDERAQAAHGTRFRDAYATAVLQVSALKASDEARIFLADRDLDTSALRLSVCRDDAMPIVYTVELAECAALCDRMYKAMFGARTDLLQKGLRLGGIEVEGVKDFDLESGNRLAPGADWMRHVFDPPLKVTCVVTAGISSCAGGVTVTVDEDPAAPEHVILWHLDASLSIPLLCEMERVWPKGKGAPPMRSLAVVTPSLWELNKYRMDNLYPEAVVGDCNTAFLARSSHWYAEQPVVAGCDLFGLDLRTAGQADLVFTYDIDKRTEPLGMFRDVAADSEDAAPLLAHFRRNLLGAYRHDEADPRTPKEMTEYVATVATRVQQDVVAIRRAKRETNNKSCRIPRMSGPLVDAVAKQSTPLLETDVLLAAEQGEQELSHHTAHRWTPGSR